MHGVIECPCSYSRHLQLFNCSMWRWMNEDCSSSNFINPIWCVLWPLNISVTTNVYKLYPEFNTGLYPHKKVQSIEKLNPLLIVFSGSIFSPIELFATIRAECVRRTAFAWQPPDVDHNKECASKKHQCIITSHTSSLNFIFALWGMSTAWTCHCFYANNATCKAFFATLINNDSYIDNFF